MVAITHGFYPPIVTPFDADDAVDYDYFAEHLTRLADAGVDGVVVAGSTGERATLHGDEHRQLIEFAVETVDIPIVAGTGSPSTAETLDLSEHADDVGAAGLLVLPPYYSSPSEDHVAEHYRTVADAVDIPLIVYNYPGGAGYNLPAELVLELAAHPNIVGVKESSGDMPQLHSLIEGAEGTEFGVMSGWDTLALSTVSAGGTGLIGMMGNLFPADIVDLLAAAEEGDFETARTIHRNLALLEPALMAESAPITLKEGMAYLGYGETHTRAPLNELDDALREAVHRSIDRYRENVAAVR